MCDIGVQSNEGVRFINVCVHHQLACCVHHQLACFVHITIFHMFFVSMFKMHCVFLELI
jgi:hypothetical protein